MDTLKEYEVDSSGRIKNAGKFENELLATPFYWESAMQNEADETVTTNDTTFDYFKLDTNDIDELEERTGIVFGMLREAEQQGHYYRVFTDSQGFVHGQIVDAGVLEQHQDEELEESDNDELREID